MDEASKIVVLFVGYYEKLSIFATKSATMIWTTRNN